MPQDAALLLEYLLLPACHISITYFSLLVHKVPTFACRKKRVELLIGGFYFVCVMSYHSETF